MKLWRVISPHHLVLCGLMVALLAWAGTASPRFVSWETQAELSAHVWEMALLAVPMTLIVISGGIDLSVGSTMSLCAVVLGLVFEQGISPWPGGLLAIAAGVALGGLNGWFVAKVRVHPLIVTLATLALYRGVAEGISLGRPISGFPDGFAVIGRGTCLGLPVAAWVFALVAAVASVVLHKTPGGRFIYAIGHNETAARLSGVAVDRLKAWLYALSGAAAGLASVILVARRNTAKADLATGMELDVITAVVLGGTSIYGGRGSVIGTLLGVALIHEAREWVGWRYSSAELTLIVVGGLLIVSVLANRLFRGQPELC